MRFALALLAALLLAPAAQAAEPWQSAGAINTLALVASPLAAGQFHKAMALSGGISVAANLPVGSTWFSK